MPTNPFATQPSGGRLKDHMGKLLIVTPTEYIEDFQTSIGDTNVIVADVVVLDEKDVTKSKEENGMIIFGRTLVPFLKRLLDSGKPALGRMGKRKSSGAGKSDAYVLDPASPEDIKLAIEYRELQQANPFATPPADAEAE